MKARSPWHRIGVVLGGFVLTGCQTLFGVSIDDLPASGGGAGGADVKGNGGTGGASGSTGGGGSAGSGAGGAAGDGGAGAGGAGPLTRLDATFGTQGVVALRPTGIYADRYELAPMFWQADGKLVVAGSARRNIAQNANIGQRSGAFLVRFVGDQVEAGFGDGGRVSFDRGNASNKHVDDRLKWASVDAATGTLFAAVDHFDFGVEPPPTNVPFFWAADAQGATFDSRFVEGSYLAYAGLVVSSGIHCFGVRGHLVEGQSGEPSRGLDFADCSGDWALSFGNSEYLAEAEELTVLPFSSQRPAVLPQVAGDGLFWFALIRPGEVGLLRLNDRDYSSPTLDPTFGPGGRGYMTLKPDALDPSLRRDVAGIAHDPVGGGAFLAGAALLPDGSGGAPQRQPFVVKVRADGQGVDASFAGGAVVEAPGDSEWSCLVADAQGRPIVAGRRLGQPVAVRFTPAGQPDETFAPRGALALPFEPSQCTLDAAGGLLVAGPFVDRAGVAGFKLARVRLDDGAFHEATPPPDDTEEACVAVDPGEPDGPTSPLPMRNRAGNATTVNPPLHELDGKGLLRAGDVDWFVFHGNTYGGLNPAPEVAVDSSLSVLDVCLYVLESSVFSCPSGLTPAAEQVPGYLGCCGARSARITYTPPPNPGDDVTSSDALVRVSHRDPAAACELYTLSASFAGG